MEKRKRGSSRIGRPEGPITVLCKQRAGIWLSFRVDLRRHEHASASVKREECSGET